jgi:hypothetical protein
MRLEYKYWRVNVCLQTCEEYKTIHGYSSVPYKIIMPVYQKHAVSNLRNKFQTRF